MNLQFGICWIEDQASDAKVDAVRDAIRAVGFEPQIERVEAEEDIRKFARRQEHFQEYDLILLDLRLGNGLYGDELAPEIRRAFRSTTILFYSAEDEETLRGRMASKRVEGAYCTHRDRLEDRVGELVTSMSPALNRLSSMRGLAARVVAECDQELRVVLSWFGAQGAEVEIVDSLKSRVTEAGRKQQEALEPLNKLSRVLASHAITSGILFAEMKDCVHKFAKSDGALDLLRQLKNYQPQMLHRRNALAHALETQTDKGWRIEREGGSTLTVDDFARYRRDFIANLKALRSLRELLVGK